MLEGNTCWENTDPSLERALNTYVMYKIIIHYLPGFSF